MQTPFAGSLTIECSTIRVVYLATYQTNIIIKMKQEDLVVCIQLRINVKIALTSSSSTPNSLPAAES